MSRNIPPVEVNNYATIFTAPIFKNQNGEWYRDVGYSDSIDLIRENFLGARKSFVAIGYYLKHIKVLELYKEGGYANIWECAKEEFGLSQPAASNYMKMNDTYSVNGDTPILDEKYAGFNKSQLQEMLALPEEMRKRIIPEQTVTNIRDIAKEEKGSKEPSESEIREFFACAVKDMDDEPRNTLKDRLRERYRHRHYSGGKFEYNGSSRGISINRKEEITWSQLVKLIERYFPKEIKEKEKDEQLPGQININDYPGIVPQLQKAESDVARNNKFSTEMKLWLSEFMQGKLSQEKILKGFIKHYVIYDDCLIANVQDDIILNSEYEDNGVESIMLLKKILKDFCV